MLNKILSTLRFNPDYLELLKEYQVKQSREKLIRGIGFGFIALAFIVQIFAYTPMSAQTNASASANDLITGGVSSKQQIVDDCNNGINYVAIIYGTYGVSCNDIASPNSSVVSLNSTDYNGSLWSVGHLPYGIAGETPVSIFGGGTIYWRLLHGWDTHGFSTYTALKVTADNGLTYYILFTCGNLVSVGFPSPYVRPTPAPTPAPAPAPKPIPPPAPAPAPCIYNSALEATNPSCKPCTDSKTNTDIISCLFFSKSATNITKNIADANNTMASPGDTIQYTINVQNKGKATVNGYIIQDNLSDVLEYSDISNVNSGTLSSTNMISWPAIDIPAGGAVSKQFTVIVKNPIPNFAINPDDPQGYNNIMTNVYGNSINISVPKSPITVVSNVTTQSLPNTGPGTGIFIMFLITTAVGYFYSRSRLLNKEALIAEKIEI